ncbi:MAG: methylated-DNA-[protein]-cysteine S-methyltransferase [Streptosporangiaceae bacterium]|nr:methylated-DNA-[protein]-cysteine S-methyltransferase [Streptosporangiaceae bacterium]
MERAQATIDTPVGPVSVTGSDAGLTRVSFRRSRPATPSPAATPTPARSGLLSAACEQLVEYFSGQRRAFDLPIDWSAASGPQQQVLSVLFGTVGYGETVTYGLLARRAGLGDGGPDLPARAVGTIMGSNPWPLIVPCHRVVASDGLGGYSGGTGIEIKRWLLIFEGALPATLDWDPAGAAGIWA